LRFFHSLKTFQAFVRFLPWVLERKVFSIFSVNSSRLDAGMSKSGVSGSKDLKRFMESLNKRGQNALNYAKEKS